MLVDSPLARAVDCAVRRGARDHPDVPAVIDAAPGGRTVTYAELDSAASVIAPDDRAPAVRGDAVDAVTALVVGLRRGSDLAWFCEPGAALECPAVDAMRDEIGPLVLLPTSGTSAGSRLVVHDHRSIGSATAAVLRHRDVAMGLEVRPGPAVDGLAERAGARLLGFRFLLTAPLGTTAGLTVLLQALVAGETMVHLPSVSGAEILDAVERWEIASTSLSPLAAHSVARAAQLGRRAPLLSAGIGGGPVAAETAAAIETLLGCLVTLSYGATETAGPIAMSAPGDPAAVRHGSVGRAVADAAVRVADDGIVEVTSASLAHGYLTSGGPCDLARAADGWWRTGDLGSFDDVLHVLGRSDDEIVRGGVRVDVVAIEQAVRELPGVDDVAVVPRPARRHGVGTELVAVVECTGDRPALANVRAASRSAGCAVSELVVVGELPRSGDGSVRRAQVRNDIAGAPS